jgi:hypothetical protein
VLTIISDGRSRSAATSRRQSCNSLSSIRLSSARSAPVRPDGHAPQRRHDQQAAHAQLPKHLNCSVVICSMLSIRAARQRRTSSGNRRLALLTSRAHRELPEANEPGRTDPFRQLGPKKRQTCGRSEFGDMASQSAPPPGDGPPAPAGRPPSPPTSLTRRSRCRSPHAAAPKGCTAKATISALEWTWSRSLTLRCLASSQG